MHFMLFNQINQIFFIPDMSHPFCKNLHFYPVFAERGISFLWDITEEHMTKIAGFFAHSGKWSKLKK